MEGKREKEKEKGKRKMEREKIVGRESYDK